jgi:integrase
MASVFKRPGRDVWEFKYKDAAGKWRYGVGWPDKKRTKDHAHAVEADCRAVRKGEKEDPRLDLEKRNTPAATVVSEYLTWGQRQGGRHGKPWDEQNAALKRSNLNWWLEGMKLQRLTDIDLVVVETLVQDLLNAGKSPKTAALKVESLRSLCRWAVQRRYLRHNPMDGMGRMDKAPLLPHRALESAEVAALLGKAPEPRRTWYLCALGTGFRLNELRNLKVKNLDPFGPSIFLPAEHSKDRKDHRQPISRDLLAQLQTLATGHEQDAPLLGIPLPGAHKTNRYDPAGLFAADCRLAGIPMTTDKGKTTWHSLRKAFVTNVVKSGADLKTCMTLARHSTASLTMETYAADDPALVREAALKAEEAVKNAVRCCTGVAKRVAVAGGDAVSLDGESRLHEVKMVGDTGLEPVNSPYEDSANSSTSIGKPDGIKANPRRLKDGSQTPPCCTGVADSAPWPLVREALLDGFGAILADAGAA